MRKLFFQTALLLVFALLVDCNDDQPTQISKEGAVETILNVDHLDATHDLIVTTHKVWIKNQLVKTFVSKDTIPSLGDTSQVGENSEGETKNISLKKDYEIYITVK